MKTNKLILIIILLLSIHSFAQQNHYDKKEQIRALKVGFITNELTLTADEAAKFWPLYNDYDNKQFKLRHHKTKVFKEKMEANLSNMMSEKEASNLLVQMENNEDLLYQNRKKFILSLKGILPSVKIIKLKKAEDDFNKKLLEQYRNKGPKR